MLKDLITYGKYNEVNESIIESWNFCTTCWYVTSMVGFNDAIREKEYKYKI